MQLWIDENMLEEDMGECVIILHPYPNKFLSMQGGCFADQLKE